MGHESFKGALKDGFINVGVSSISAFIANKIGQGRLEQLRGTNTVSDYVLHKMYHGVLGAARGVAFAALRGENVGSAALGGAVGGIVAEVVAEGMRESMLQRADGRFAEESKGLSDAKKIQLYNTIRAQELEKIRCCGEAAAVIMATLFKCDIAHAQGAARNAIENNSAMAFSWGCPPDLMRNIQAALAAGAAGAVAAGEAVAAGVAAAGGAVVAASAVGVIVVVGGVYYYVTMDSEPAASAPKPESFPEEESKPKVHSTPVHDDSRPKVNSTPVAESSKPSDKGFDTYEGPDARVFTSDRKDNCSKGESSVWKGFQPYKGTVKTNGLRGKNKEFYQWDFTHNDIEVFNKDRQHLGSMDPQTGKIYKPAVPARKLNL